MHTQRLLAASATLALSMLGGQAFAEDGKAFPGSACQAQFDHVEATISRSNASILNAGSQRVNGLPPWKWSSLRYGFAPGGGHGNGKEAAYGGGDRSQATAG
jgi:hypothetical protein